MGKGGNKNENPSGNQDSSSAGNNLWYAGEAFCAPLENPLFKNYNHTYNVLQQASLEKILGYILLQAFWDTYGASARKTGLSPGRSSGDFAVATYQQQTPDILPTLEQNATKGAFLTPRSWGKALVGLQRKTSGKPNNNMNHPIRVIARSLWNIAKIPELFVNILDDTVEALLAKSLRDAADLNVDVISFLKLIYLVPALIILVPAHIGLKILSASMRLVFSSANAWKEADAIDWRLGVAARVATLALTVGLCFAVPVLAPYFSVVHAPMILSAIAPTAIYLAGTLPYALPAGLAILTGIPQLGKMFTHQFSKQFNELMNAKPRYNAIEEIMGNEPKNMASKAIFCILAVITFPFPAQIIQLFSHISSLVPKKDDEAARLPLLSEKGDDDAAIDEKREQDGSVNPLVANNNGLVNGDGYCSASENNNTDKYDQGFGFPNEFPNELFKGDAFFTSAAFPKKVVAASSVTATVQSNQLNPWKKSELNEVDLTIIPNKTPLSAVSSFESLAQGVATNTGNVSVDSGNESLKIAYS